MLFYFNLLCFLAIPPKFTYYAHSGTYYAQNYAQKFNEMYCESACVSLKFNAYCTEA